MKWQLYFAIFAFFVIFGCSKSTKTTTLSKKAGIKKTSSTAKTLSQKIKSSKEGSHYHINKIDIEGDTGNQISSDHVDHRKVDSVNLADFSGPKINQGEGYFLNSKSNDLEVFIEFVAKATGKKILYNPSVRGPGRLAPRAFGEMAVQHMESYNDPSLKKTIIAFCRYFSIVGKYCSLLMLERAEDYKQFKIKLTKDTRLATQAQIALLLKKALANFKTKYKDSFKQFWEKIKEEKLANIQTKVIDHLLQTLELDKKDFAIKPVPLNGKLRYNSQVPKSYLESRNYLEEAHRRYKKNNIGDCVRVISSIVEENASNPSLLRMAGYSLYRYNLSQYALELLTKVRNRRPFEPQSYRDLARCFAKLGKYPIAALYFEIVLAAKWQNRFQNIQNIVQDEYIQMLKHALHGQKLQGKKRKLLKKRLKLWESKKVFLHDIVVTVTWNTDNTDVDL